jgi:hypothetical protein
LALHEILRPLLVNAGVEPAALRDLLQRCSAGEPGLGEVAQLGGYLHAVLFGANWAQIAALGKSVPVEIQLHFPYPDSAIAGLPWEMMHAPDAATGSLTPLACHPQCNLAIVRVLRSKQRSIQLPEMPLRVLFAVGRQLDDALRPGAEYLGLLRNLGLDAGASADNARISLRVLTETTSDELETAMDEFRPHVVHFICHGQMDAAEGARLLLTKREFDDPSRAKTNQAAPCNASRLLLLLTQKQDPHRVPAVVVLNACHTADAGIGAMAGQSMAAQLVAGGIPVVLAMAGEVADGACRIYTRGFYLALVAGDDLSFAAAKARQAAMRHYKDFDRSIEWARLVFFAGADMGGRLPPPAPQSPEEQRAAAIATTIAKAAKSYFPMHGCILCDRLDAVSAYDKFRKALGEGSRQVVLAVGATTKAEEDGDRFSKTRLLDHIAIQAVFDGFNPCKMPMTKDPPANLLEFAFVLGRELEAVRQRFGLLPPGACDLFDLAAEACHYELPPETDPPFRIEQSRNDLQHIISELPSDSTCLRPEGIRAALKADFQRLRIDFENALGQKRQALILIDDLHRYEGVTEPLLLQLINNSGLVHDGERPVPVIFTYSRYDQGNIEVSVAPHIKEFLKVKSALVMPLELSPIQNIEERRLAYTQYLLTRKSLAPSVERSQRKFVAAFFEAADETIKGVPSRFERTQLETAMRFGKLAGTLLEANDEHILNNP